jgi:lipopolysaccharide/colanic/teichoic acid biosynthesis glycosyltransferase
VKLGSPGPVLFRHARMGKNFLPFDVLKFRTMVQDAPKLGGPITFGDDPRITRIGRLLRKSKIDELPQLFNVLLGEMSMVGPRPEVRKYVEMFRADYEEILRFRPGITDLASIEFCDEADLLGRAADPEAEYVGRVLPEKIRLAKKYIQRQSLFFDLKIIFGTLFRIARPQRMGGSS